MKAFNFDLGYFENDVIRNNEERIAGFVNEVNDGYYGSERQSGSVGSDFSYDFTPKISQNDFIGSFGPDGSYNPLSAPLNLKAKLSAQNPVEQLSSRAFIPDSQNYAANIYGQLGSSTYTSRTYIGDLPNVNESWQITTLSNSAPSPLSTDISLSSAGRLSQAQDSGMAKLKTAFDAMQQRLGAVNVLSYIEAKRVDARDPNSQILHYEITVPQLSVAPGEIKRAADFTDKDRLGFKKFTFTATNNGVIEAPSGAYITPSIHSGPEGITNFSSFETAVMLVETYVRKQEVILDRGTSLAFKQFMDKQQRLGAKQTFIEVDQFLGRQLGYGTFTEAVNQLGSSGDITKFRQIQTTLRDNLLNVSERDNRVYSQVSRNELSAIRQEGVENILKPLGTNMSRESMSAQVIQNFAQVMMTPYDLDPSTGMKLDAFTELKLHILQGSSSGSSLLTQQVRMLQKEALAQLRSPFLQPHSANFSGGQLGASRVYYSNMPGALMRPDMENTKLAFPGAYSHGSQGLPVGQLYIPISQQSSDKPGFMAQFHDSQLSKNSTDTVSFYDIKSLFKSSAQIGITNLAEIKGQLQGLGYSEVNSQKWINHLQQKLNISGKTTEDSDQEMILLLPYRKAEQTTQRLKNLSGTRSSAEYSLDYVKAVKEQKSLTNYMEGGRISRAKTLSGNVNTVLPSAQYAYLESYIKDNNLNPETNQVDADRVTYHLRELEANPLSELRGFAGAQAQKRILIQTGLNQSSDFMHVNSAHEAMYGYEQYTKIELENIVEYSTAGNKIFSQNLALDKQRQLLQKVFQPGRRIFYSPTILQHEATQSLITNRYEALAQRYGGITTNAEGVVQTNHAAIAHLKQEFNFIKGISLKDTGLEIQLREGLYGENSRGTFQSFGLFEEGTSKLIVGLGVTANQDGDLRHVKSFAVKISGTLRADQQGVAVVNDQIHFSEEGGRLVGKAAYTIMFDGSVRPGVENVKGPARFDTEDGFNYHAANLKGHEFYSERTLDRKIYATASSASLKGYNYESGLDILSTKKSFDRFSTAITTDRSKTVALFASYFASSLESYATDRGQKESLKALAGDLRLAIANTLELNGNRAERSIAASVRSGKVSKDLTKNNGLFVNNSGLFSLIAGADSSAYGIDSAEPLIQLQQEMLKALKGGSASSTEFVNRIINLFDMARSNQHSKAIGEHRSFNQDSSVNRGASIVASILGLTYQSIGYSENQRNNPAGAAMLELGLLTKEGRINKEVLLGEHHAAAMSLFISAKGQLPTPNALKKLRAQYESNPNADLSKDKTYQTLESIAANVYAASQGAIPLEVSIRVQPSKILQAAGSKDSAGLEYHYSIAMSKRNMDRMKGYIQDPTALSEITHAFHMMTNFNESKGMKGMKYLSAFGGARTEAYVDMVKFMRSFNSVATELKNNSGTAYSHFANMYARGAAMDGAQITNLLDSMQQIHEVAYQYLGSVEEFNSSRRALSLATLADARRFGNAEHALTKVNPVQNPFEFKNKKIIFFDIETKDLVDVSKAVGDASREPGIISELTFIHGKEGRGQTIVEGHLDNPSKMSVSSALDKLALELKGNYDSTVLAGHNIRVFDVPTLFRELTKRGVDVNRIHLIDTYNDVNRSEASKKFGMSSFKLGSVYEMHELHQLQKELRHANTSEQRKNQIRRDIQTKNYGQYDAHVAIADVKANMGIFDFLVENNLFDRRKSIAAPAQTGKLSAQFFNNVFYFNTTGEEHISGQKDGLFAKVLQVAESVVTNAGKHDIFYELYKNQNKYLEQSRGSGFAEGIVYEYVRKLLDLGTNNIGRLKGIKEGQSVSQFLTVAALKSDQKLRGLIETGLEDSPNAYIDAKGKLAESFLLAKAEIFLAHGNSEAYRRADEAFKALHESKTVVLPLLEISRTDQHSQIKARFVSTGALRGEKAMFGNSMLLLGLDILKQLPQEFANFTPDIIRHGVEVDSVLPEYFRIVQSIHAQIIQHGEAVISPYEERVISRMEGLADKNRELITKSVGGAFAQRAFGEKTKFMGVSSTAVASYLVQIDEIVLGARYSKTMGLGEKFVARSGGPSGASPQDQEHRNVSTEEIALRAEDLNSFVVLDRERNKTTAIVSIFGRFGSQGGDFDGDTYAVLAKYQEQILVHQNMLSNKESLLRQQKSLQYEQSLTFAGNQAKLEQLKAAVAEHQGSPYMEMRLDPNVRRLFEESGTLDVQDKFTEIYAKSFRAQLVKQVRDLNRENAAPMLSEFVKTLNGDSKVSADQIVAFLREHKPAQSQEHYLKASNAAYTAAFDWLTRRLDKVSIKDQDYLDYLQGHINSTASQLAVIQNQLNSKETEIHYLKNETTDIAKRAVASMRTHVAAYIGLPTTFLAEEAGLFHNNEVFSMIEQQRGVTPGLDDLSVKVLAQDSSRSHALNLMASIHAAAFTDKKMTAQQQQSHIDRLITGKMQGTAEEIKAAQAVESFVQSTGLETLGKYSAYQKANALSTDMNTDAMEDTMQMVAKLTSNAGGTAMSSKSFEGMQSVIGAAGTSLIGEAYNAITTLMGKSIIARGIAESFVNPSQHTGVHTGTEQSFPDSGQTMLDITKGHFEALFPTGHQWGAGADPEQKAQMDEARNILADVFNNRAGDLASASLNRAQNLTGLLANVQQTVRDSLKPKQDGTMLDSIRSSKLGKSNNTILDILVSADSTNDERYVAMRKFLGEEAGEAIMNISNETTYRDRYQVTSFGALFLMSDFMRTETTQDFKNLIGIGATSKDPKDVQRYQFLNERYETIQQLAQSPTISQTQRDRYLDMLQDPQHFVAQSVIDLMNIALAERRVYQAAFVGGEHQDSHLKQMQIIRQATMLAFGGQVPELIADLTPEQIKLQQDFAFNKNQANYGEYSHDVQTALFIGANGEDLLKTEQQKVDAYKHVGLEFNSDPLENKKTEFEFYQRMTVQFLYAHEKHNGLEVRDVYEMRDTFRATKHLQSGTVEGGTIFKGFVEQSASATDALMTQLMRDQISHPREISIVSYEAGSQLFLAMGDLHETLRGVYGDSAVNLMTNTKGEHGPVNVPVETLQAYRSAQNVFGVFSHMFDRNMDPEVKQHVANMFGISLATKNAKGESGYTQMAYMLSGLAQVQRNDYAMMRNSNEGYSDPVAEEMHKAYAEAIAKDKAIDPSAKYGEHQTNFIMAAGKSHIAQEGFGHITLDQQAKLMEHEYIKHARTSLLSAFVAPAFFAIVGGNIEADANLINRGIDLMQAATQVTQVHDAKRWNSATLFQLDQINRTLKSEGLAFGSVRAVTSELLFEVASRFAHQAIGGKGGRAGTLIAEVLFNALASMLTYATTDREYGANRTGEDNYQGQAIYELPGLGVGIAANAIDEFLTNNSMEGEDEEINYDIQLATKGSENQDMIETNYARLDIYDDFGQVDTEFN